MRHTAMPPAHSSLPLTGLHSLARHRDPSKPPGQSTNEYLDPPPPAGLATVTRVSHFVPASASFLSDSSFLDPPSVPASAEFATARFRVTVPGPSTGRAPGRACPRGERGGVSSSRAASEHRPGRLPRPGRAIAAPPKSAARRIGACRARARQGLVPVPAVDSPPGHRDGRSAFTSESGAAIGTWARAARPGTIRVRGSDATTPLSASGAWSHAP